MRSAFLALIVMTAGCAPLAPCPKCPPGKPAPETAVYLQFTFDGLPGWPSADLDRSLRTFLAGCPRSGPFSQVCARAASVPPDDPVAARAFFEANFVPYALVSSDGPDSGLITGYYEPIIEGSRTPRGGERYPPFRVARDPLRRDVAAVTPDVRTRRLRGRLDGLRVVPYPSRGEIDARGVPAQVIAWASDPVELFFLHIQGSGQVRLQNGARTRIRP